MYERTILSGDWMALVFKGVLILLFGILALVSPGLTAFVVIFFLGLVLLFNGVMFLLLVSRSSPRRWFHLIEGLVNIIAGILIFIRPGISFLVIVWMFGIWLFVSGVFTMIAASDFSHSVSIWARVFQVINGILVLILSWFLFSHLISGLLVLSTFLGLLAITVGVVLIFSAYSLKKLPRGIPEKT